MPKNTITGGLLVEKPQNMTSHDVVAITRRALNQKRVGHAGTLDPFAEGLLVILLGPATRLEQYVHDLPKTYVTTITLGTTSDTDDKDGTLQAKSDRKPDQQELQQALDTFKGVIEQIPPAYSAIKIKGEKMYDLARRGEKVTPKPRQVTIHEIKLIDYTYPNVQLEITCSTGTYIRAIARDIGSLLSTGAYASSLKRTHIGQWGVEKSVKVENIAKDSVSTPAYIQPSELVSHLQKVTLPDESVAKLIQGRAVPWNNMLTKADNIAVVDNSETLVGIASFDPENKTLSPSKILPY